MPIDPRIPLQVNPPQIDSPIQMASNFLSLQQAREQSMQRMREQQEDNQIRSIFQQSQGDIETALPQIRQINPMKAAAIEETYSKSRKASAELGKLDLEMKSKTQELLAQELGNVTDQASYDHYRAYAAAVRQSAGLPAPSLSPTYSPETIEQYKQSGMAIKDQLAAKHQELVDRETGRHNLATEGLMASGQALTAENTAADNARQAEAAAETARHNRSIEAISRGNLGVALGNLNLRKQELNKPGAVSTKPPTGAQGRALNFFNRAKQASDEIDTISDEIANLSLAGQARLSLPNFMQSQTGQTYTAAQRAFTEARLRKDSGAAIPEHEFENDKRTYFVQPGDTKKTIAQKTRARAALLASLAYESGPALSGFYGESAPDMLETYKQISSGKTAPSATAAPGAKKADPMGIR